MAVTDDIVATWRRPRAVMRKLLSAGRREDRALAILMVGCLLTAVAQWPYLTRLATLKPDVATDPTMLKTDAFVGWMMLAPLAFYLIAAGSHLLARAFGGKGSWFGARLALFWSYLATTPLILLTGLLSGFNGSEVRSTQIMFILTVAAFVVIWVQSLREAESIAE